MEGLVDRSSILLISTNYYVTKEKKYMLKRLSKYIIIGIITILLPLIINKIEPFALLLVYDWKIGWRILIGFIVVFVLAYYIASCLALKSNMEDDKIYTRYIWWLYKFRFLLLTLSLILSVIAVYSYSMEKNILTFYGYGFGLVTTFLLACIIEMVISIVIILMTKIMPKHRDIEKKLSKDIKKMIEKNDYSSAVFIYQKWIPSSYDLDKPDRSNYMMKSILSIVKFNIIAAGVLSVLSCFLFFVILILGLIIIG